jgi:hypothetical protein
MLKEMGVPLRLAERETIQSVFRDARRRA